MLGEKVRIMKHMNQQLPCVIDVETTGTNPIAHEVIQIAIVPLNFDFRPLKTIQPFYTNIIPERLETIQPEALKVSKLTIGKLQATGLPSDTVRKCFDEWFDRLDLPITTSGRQKRILPIGYNYGFDQAFLKRFFGAEVYDDYFAAEYRDAYRWICSLNDRYVCNGEPAPFAKKSLAWACNVLGVEHTRQHDALGDCYATAELYRKLMTRYMP